MRVLYFSDNSSEHNRQFLEKLSSSGHETWFLSCGADRPLPGWLPDGIKQVSPKTTFPRDADPSRFEKLVPEFKEVLRQIKPDLVHAGPVQSTAYVAALADFHPLLVMSWGSDLLLHAHHNSEWRRATETALQAADGLFCDCTAVRSAADEFASFPDSNVVQFPWGIQQGVFGPIGPLPAVGLSSEPNAIYLISTRSWEPLYDLDVLLESFRVARARDPRLRLLLLGSGSQAGRVENFLMAHGLKGAVLTPGFVAWRNLPEWFRAAQGYLSCARSDGTSVSLLEAMATGLPVVVTDIPSNREWVQPGQNGWLAEAGSVEQFSQAILRVANLTASQAQKISARNQQVVADRADWDRNFPLLLAMYDRLLAAKSSK